MEYVNCAGILLTLVLIVLLWIDLKRDLLDIQRRLPKRRDHLHHPAPTHPGQYSVWAYRKGEWRLERECSAPGFEAGPPPGRQGHYEGEVVRTRGVRRKKGG